MQPTDRPGKLNFVPGDHRPFRFGDHATFQNGSKGAVFGMVAKVGRDKVRLQTKADGTGYSIPLFVLRHAEGPLPAELAALASPANLFRKGEFVEADDQRKPGTVLRGMVSKDQRAGNRVAVDCGDLSMLIPSSQLRRVAAPAKPDAGPMADYSIRGYKVARFASEETECFKCTILHKGRPVLEIRNEGQGGCNRMDGMRVDVEAFEAACKAWAAWAGYRHLGGADAVWLEWEQYERPMGQTAQSVAQAFEAEMAGHAQQRLTVVGPCISDVLGKTTPA